MNPRYRPLMLNIKLNTISYTDTISTFLIVIKNTKRMTPNAKIS